MIQAPIKAAVLLAVLTAACPLEGLPAQGTTTASRPAQTPSRSVLADRSAQQSEADARAIDRILAGEHRRYGVTILPEVDDATFLRRATLSATGRIPTVDEARQFLLDDAEDKRGLLIDRLLDSPGWTSNEANHWFDLLRVKSRQRQSSGEPFAHWLRESLQSGMPYDEMVRQMLAAEGPAHRDGNGATGLLMRDRDMPHDAMANALRVFLGTRLECAQCHNHPFESWTQQDFYGMAAFFGGLRYRVQVDRQKLAATQASLRGADDRTRRAARLVLQTTSLGLSGSGTGSERLPKDYAYDDASPGDAVQARTIFGQQVQLQKPPTQPQRRPRLLRRRPQGNGPATQPIGSRRDFAEWLTAEDNPRFTTVAVNRVFERLFGRALITPLDDIKDDTKASLPRLQEHLEQLLIRYDHDLRQLQRTLMRTRLFRTTSYAEDPDPELPYRFQGPVLRRLSAEQMWDSLLTLADDSVDNHLQEPDTRARQIYDIYEQASSASPDELATMIQERADPQRRRAQLQQQREQRQQEMREAFQQARPLQRQLVAARRRGDTEKVQELTRELAAMGFSRNGRPQRQPQAQLQRASDLTQPAPEGHLLRQFGQSDRETVDGSSRDGTVPQALTMINGLLDQRILAATSSLRRHLQASDDPQVQIETAFLATLCRKPTDSECELWSTTLAEEGGQGLQDLVWVLCNSHEFRFQR